MRYRLMASYQGSPFEAGVGPGDGDIVLFAACPPPEELGFEPATGHWRKQIPIREVQAVWESRPVGLFRGARCMVLDDLGDRLHIGYLGHDAQQAERLGYWQVDRGVYELVAARNEVSEIVEERTEYPRKPELRGSSPGLAEQPGYPQLDDLDYSGYPSAESSGYLSSTPTGSSPGYLPSGPIGYRTASDSGAYSWAARPTDTGSFRRVDDTGSLDRPGYQGGQPEAGSVSPAAAEEAPLPLEAAAMRAATESRRRPRQTAAQRRAAAAESAASTVPDSPPVDDQAAAVPAPEPAMVGAAQVAETAAVQSARAQEGSAFSAADIPATVATATQATPAAVGQATPAAVAQAAPAAAGQATPAAAAQAAPAAAGPGTRTSSARTRQATTPAGTANLAGGPQRASAPLLTEEAPAERAIPSDEALTTAEELTGYAGSAEPTPGSETGQEPERRSARRRLATERMFSELANLAAIPVDAYAIGEEVEGALCLLQTDRGFEVFHSVEGNRYELQYFSTEESACFYLFGVLAAEGVRTGSLVAHSGTPPFARPSR